MNSSDGEYQVAPVAEVGNLPDYDQTEEDDWETASKLAKDAWMLNEKGYLENYRPKFKHTFKPFQIKQGPQK